MPTPAATPAAAGPPSASSDADRARDHAQHDELHDEQRQRLALRRAEAAQHRRGVEMAAQVARRGERDRDRGEHHRDQRREAEELLRALERLPHFGPQVADVLHPLSGLQLAAAATSRYGSSASRAGAVGDQQPVRRAIARLQQVGRRDVVEVDAAAAARSRGGRSPPRAPAARSAVTLSVASPTASASPTLHAEPRREPRVGPGLAARRECRRRGVPLGVRRVGEQ